MNKLLRVCLCGLVVAHCAVTYALPPLGLTQITPTIPTLFFSQPSIEIIGETTYLGMENGIWTIDSTGTKTFLPISHPLLGSSYYVTPVVKTTNGDLYVGANFRNAIMESQPALFSLNQLHTPIVTWDHGSVSSVDVNLRTFGNVEGGCSGCYAATYFYLDGSTEEMQFPIGSDSSNNSAALSSSTPRGFAVGDAGIPMTASSGAVMWTPEGEISFFTPFQVGDADSIRDRNGAEAPNIGWNYDVPYVSYGDGRNFKIYKADGSSFDEDFYEVIVSHEDFAIVEVFEGLSTEVSTLYGFYPGIIPGFPDRAVPLLDIFPELAAIDIDIVNDLASVDGYIYMTLHGDDGLYLFGARDPSVIPEPTGVVMMMLAATFALRRRRR
jgi:hypothetical protein